MGGLGRGDPLWIFFAFVFNAMWEKSTPMPPSHDPDGPLGLEGCFLPQKLLLRIRPAIGTRRPSPVIAPILCPRHCYAK